MAVWLAQPAHLGRTRGGLPLGGCPDWQQEKQEKEEKEKKKDKKVGVRSNPDMASAASWKLSRPKKMN